MTSKILNDTGNTLYCSTFRDEFNRKIAKVLGDAFIPSDIPEDETPELK
jgi:hypothetical protein